ncbi:hypothetical protein GH714_031954 [Hevea brasiliensis]|uniref:Pentatricopeptide repeat-containing protein n=1 Tax=Hevea brasiliensis TaxID=3981 RepID=A0A6A6LIJ6_HEVBR|nr:hypothetical protein GH714_031954 [Hevea brasiliensis]
MKLDGARPNEFTFAVTECHCGLSAIRLGHLLHACTEKSGFKDYVTVGNALINMYAKSGNIQAANKEGFCYLNQMKESNIVPGLEHYTCIVGLLSKAGRLDDAQNFMRSMPVKWDVVAWRTLLNACHIHRNYGLGKRIAEWVLEMDPNDVGTYMLLSNMYAKAKRWDGVVKIRKLMRDKNLKKEPGVSWIEIRNVAHVFVSEDTKHPEHNEI